MLGTRLSRKQIQHALRRINKVRIRGDEKLANEMEEKIIYKPSFHLQVSQKLRDADVKETPISIDEKKPTQAVEDKKEAPISLEKFIEKVNAECRKATAGQPLNNEEDFNKILETVVKFRFQIEEKRLESFNDPEISKEGEAIYQARTGFKELVDELYTELSKKFQLSGWYSRFELVNKEKTVERVAHPYEEKFSQIASAKIPKEGNIADIFALDFLLHVEFFRATIKRTLEKPGVYFYSADVKALLLVVSDNRLSRDPGVSEGIEGIFNILLNTPRYAENKSTLFNLRQQLVLPAQEKIRSHLWDVVYSSRK